MKKFFITTPIYYANDLPHIGHAYTTIAADALARYHRMAGNEVFFLTGTDEHGAKIQEIAEKKNQPVKDFVDEISARFAFAWDCLNISNDYFIRTTDPEHQSAVQRVLIKLFKEKYIYKGKYEALYCVGCEQYKTRAELKDGKCPDHKRPPEVYSEEAYMFKLSQFSDKLLHLIETDQLKISPEKRKNEMISFYKKEGLLDIAISRKKTKVSWGIELPFDKAHTTYVWVDAFLNYLTGLGWSPFATSFAKATEVKKASGDKPQKKELYKKFWPADVHLMSKDILRVHATIWPGLLLALGEELPKQLFIHGYFTIEGQKMSKSLGNVIDPVALVSKYTVDASRYYILREIPFGEDGDFREENLKNRYNSDLAHGLGNLCSRVLTMAEKYLKARVPDKISRDADLNATDFWSEWEKSTQALAFHQALIITWDFIRCLDRKINDQKPWILAKNNQKQLADLLYVLLESLRHVAWMIMPFMPETADKIFEQLGILKTEKKKKFSEAKKWGGLKPGRRIKLGKTLFPKINL